MAHVGLEASEGQEAPALGLGETLETSRVGKMEGAEFIVALAEMGDGPRGNGDAPFTQGVMECGETPVLGLAQGADVSHDIETERVCGPGQATFGLGAIGFANLRAVRRETAPHLQRKTEDRVESGDGAVGMGSGPQRFAAAPAGASQWFHGLRCRWGRPGCLTSHRHHLQGEGIPLGSAGLASSFSSVC
jgi:hypothetical protein